MAIVASFTVAQSAITPSDITITDTSTGTYGTITSRRVYVTDAYGNQLAESGGNQYTVWPLADLTITLSILTQDTAANVRVDWVDSGGAMVDSVNANYPLSEFGKQFFFYLLQQQGLNPGVYQDTNYSSNICLFWANLVGGDNAVTYGNDIAGAQNSYNREILMQNNESFYF